MKVTNIGTTHSFEWGEVGLPQKVEYIPFLKGSQIQCFLKYFVCIQVYKINLLSYKGNLRAL